MVDPAAAASAMLTSARRGSTVTTAFLAAQRAAAVLVAATRNSGWVEDLAIREQLVVAGDRTDVVDAGDVGGGIDRDHAGAGAHRRQVERVEAGMAVVGKAEGEVERAGHRCDVIDIDRAARHMRGGAVVRDAGMDRLR